MGRILGYIVRVPRSGTTSWYRYAAQVSHARPKLFYETQGRGPRPPSHTASFNTHTCQRDGSARKRAHVLTVASSPSSPAVISEDSATVEAAVLGELFSSVVRKRLVRPGTRAKPGAWAQRRLELHASPLALLWFEPHARSEATAAELWQRLPRGTLLLAADARVEPHPDTSAPNHRRQLMVHQGDGGDGSVLRLECATAEERDAWVGAIGRALTARAASATAATEGAVAALYEAFPDVEAPLIAEVLLP